MKFLIVQTSFIGDVILSTAVAEKLHLFYPNSEIYFLVRGGNEQLFTGHPFLKKILIWDKKADKIKNLLKLRKIIRKERFTHVINLHRFFTSGFLTVASGAKETIGFSKNPFSVFFSKRFKHTISPNYDPHPLHETDRNQSLIAHLTDAAPALPKLYPAPDHFLAVEKYKDRVYSCIAPDSVWFTKRYPAGKWSELLSVLSAEQIIYLIGGPESHNFCEEILQKNRKMSVVNLSGQLSFMESAALMRDAQMNYSNDSGPIHIASAVNAPITAVFCSTIKSFGFWPLSTVSKIVEKREPLYCRPCGLHGHHKCPEGHFKCALEINTQDFL